MRHQVLHMPCAVLCLANEGWPPAYSRFTFTHRDLRDLPGTQGQCKQDATRLLCTSKFATNLHAYQMLQLCLLHLHTTAAQSCQQYGCNIPGTLALASMHVCWPALTPYLV
jgi:hypothetical protein